VDKRCPKCKLLNPAEAERCDCGWDFATNRQEGSYIRPKRGNPAPTIVVSVGAILVIVKLTLLVIHAFAH
jgi:hypothetical protein